MTQHTSGPWTVTYCTPSKEWYERWSVRGGATIVAECASEANARLIASAPDLLAVVRKHLDDHLETCHITRRGESCTLVAETRAVIAKAEGRDE